ncbi:trimeric intracellular cation channel family protein [Tianweitania sp. BSSL-BM11]|uniref:Trimeric intracellular cation channel family protein n=1 Tax=Tianweitania aestuarii TaxID=2814886 RepID=A0ABS5RZU1_9HYPH|nr:trimeric intracellular cation channel family protein [Tianweitania aestuarii]MBS9721724.1 trimeric intracellular cation channel family protein [Tianweitania aestuarii]
MDLIQVLDYAGVAVFAATGALAASRKQLDLIGFLFLAAVTGVGGGTVRDVILGLPVFWIIQPLYMIICAGVALLIYFTAYLVESRYRLLLWLDAMGLSAYCVLGAFKGLASTGSLTVAIVMGMLTAAFGGIMRDTLAGEPSVLLRPEIYVSAAMAGAVVYTLTAMLGLPPTAAALLGMATAFLIRAGAIRFGWTIPTYRSRPGRRPEDIT